MESENNNRAFKTQLCRYFEKDGNCQRGDQCNFAHGSDELRAMQGGNPGGIPQQGGNRGAWRSEGDKSGGMKKAVCNNWKNEGSCKFGDNCRFFHPRNNTQGGSFGGFNKPKGICNNWKNEGSCKFGDSCKFVHSQ